MSIKSEKLSLMHFSNRLIKTSNEGKNFMSFLIGYNFNQPEEAQAILDLYESYGEDIKKDEKAFAPIFLKFFNKFEITEDNYHYYEKFSPKWTPGDNEFIRKNNPAWNWGQTRIEYKNTLEFARGLAALCKYQLFNAECEDFLDRNAQLIEKFITNPKNKEKFIDNFNKHGLWRNMMTNNYAFFEDFCERYEFDKTHILLNSSLKYSTPVTLIESWMRDYGQPYSSRNLENLFLTIKKNKELFKDNDFFKDSHHKKDKAGNANVLETVLLLAKEEKINEAQFVSEIFKEEMAECMKIFIENPRYDNVQDWVTCWEKINTELKDGSYQKYHYRNLQNHDKNKNIQNLMILAFNQKLQNELTDIPRVTKKNKV